MQPPDPDRARWTDRPPAPKLGRGWTGWQPWRPLTVGALRLIIDGMDDSTNVVIATDDWFDNVALVHAPPLDGFPDDYAGAEWQCLTLFPGASFDAWQI